MRCACDRFFGGDGLVGRVLGRRRRPWRAASSSHNEVVGPRVRFSRVRYAPAAFAPPASASAASGALSAPVSRSQRKSYSSLTAAASGAPSAAASGASSYYSGALNRVFFDGGGREDLRDFWRVTFGAQTEPSFPPRQRLSLLPSLTQALPHVGRCTIQPLAGSGESHAARRLFGLPSLRTDFLATPTPP